MQLSDNGVFLAGLVLEGNDRRCRIHMYFCYSKLMIIGTLCSNHMPHWTAITSKGSWYRDHRRALILLLAFPVKTVEDGQIGQIELNCIAIVYEVTDGIRAFRFICCLLECEAVQMCELREMPDVRQLANVIIGEVEDFEHRDLGELTQWH